MEQRNLKRQESTEPVQPDQLLASRYPQLLKWASVLTRGDAGKAEEIVQEFCLYITLTRPDLGNVTNLDGYLYTCLRHIYLSSLARASREALHFVSVEEFDSFAFAVSGSPAGDPLQRQNDLRRICNYAVWRKQSSKSASYFILHFFHGYARREIAETARLPISAIYNKLKTARAEVRSNLEQPGKLRIVNRDAPPEPSLSWSLLSTMQLFSELRQTILRARHTECLPEQELLAHYRGPAAGPISCPLLAHIVSCERCLALIDDHFRRPRLKDREPLDVFGSAADEPGRNNQTTDRQTADTEAMLRLVHRRWGRIHEHRPNALSIAVNGQIVAFHDVRAEHNKLSARLENPDKALFAEVFSEQGLRLALLPVGAPPPDGPEVSAQHVPLSDERWLELTLTYDGLGLHSEVAYFDPALALDAAVIDNEESTPALALQPPAQPSRLAAWYDAFTRPCRALLPTWLPASAWLFALVAVATLSYSVYRHSHPSMNAAEVLHESINAENAALGGQTLHQVLHMEAASADGRILQRGTVDVWKDADGRRYMRRLYDMQHHVVAMEWKEKNGERGSRQERNGKGSSVANRALELSGLWDQDLSAQAFASLAENPPQVRTLGDGYELTRMGPTPGHPQWIAATLVLDHSLLPVRQTIRVHAGNQVRELRFVQANYERKPSTSVPDTVFDPDPEHALKDRFSSAGKPRDLVQELGGDVQLTQLQIAVLYQLFTLGADTATPIEIVRTPQGHIRVSGAVADETLKHAIATHLEALPDHQRIELRLVSSRDASARVGPSHLESARVYELNQNKSAADETLRKYFAAKGLAASALDSAVAQFSRDALHHAQRALQHAYDLDRLGNTLSVADRQAISNATQQQWTQMVEQHASDLAMELRALRAQLNAIFPASDEAPAGGPPAIENPEQFSAASGRLLGQARTLNQQIGDYFASNAFAAGQADAAPSTSLDTVPLRQAEEIASFATRLNRAAASAMLKQHDNDGDQGNTGPSR